MNSKINQFTTIIVFLFFFTSCEGHRSILGKYKNHFSEVLELKADSTFNHYYKFDLASSWTTGKWRIENDTLRLFKHLVMDTLQIRSGKHNIKVDSLVLSVNKKSNRITNEEYLSSILSSGGQNRYQPPEILYLKRKILYQVASDGSLENKKLKAHWSKKKFKTYFTKVKSD